MYKPKRKILIIDDDFDTRKSVSLAVKELPQLDIEITESSDVTSGIEQLEIVKPDVIILDLHFPGKSGFDFMDLMHESKHLSETKVIMITVDDTLENIFKAQSKGIDVYHFLGKPFNISDLRALVLGLCLPSKI